ncbi:hypothetical protein CRE_22654 [Caenorhabditis remanei]|uniref:F-box domain-containing protein n=1 Tax=Caenorhabditis remanei TaxID=31234 RepID=E3N8R9_CAERE|nr:hypothetical protein CRE_22654 [Caenorhabditis remanei]
MPVELSYPGLKCVLEFLEANKRIHISSRSPRLKRIERCVPLYLSTLNIRSNVVELNKMTYAIIEREVNSRMYPAIQFSKQVRKSVSIGVERRVQEKDGKKNYEIVREFLQGLIRGRKTIRVNQLVFERYYSTILQLPSNFKVRINKFDSGYTNPEYFLPLIDSSSFPLKELKLRYPERLDQSIVQSSEKLVIFVDEEYPRNHLIDIHKLPNRSAITKFRSLNEDTYSNIIDYWLYKRRETGKCFMINGCKTRMMEIATDLKKKYNGKMVKWNGTEFSSNPNTNYISIPLNDDFVIAVYVTSHSEDEWNSSHQIVMKTMSIDEFIPAEDSSEDKTLIKIKAPEYPGQNDLFIAFVRLLILLAIFFFVCSLLLKNKSFTKRTHN